MPATDTTIIPAFITGNKTTHAARKLTPNADQYTKLCGNSRKDRHFPTPTTGPVTCKRCLAYLEKHGLSVTEPDRNKKTAKVIEPKAPQVPQELADTLTPAEQKKARIRTDKEATVPAATKTRTKKTASPKAARKDDSVITAAATARRHNINPRAFRRWLRDNSIPSKFATEKFADSVVKKFVKATS